MPTPVNERDWTLLIPPDVPSTAQPTPGREIAHEGEVFGTTWSVRLVRKASTNPANDHAYCAQLVKAFEQALELIDAQMSLWRSGSVISRYNRLAHGDRLALPEPMAGLVQSAFDLCADTEGAFDPGLYDAVERWGFGPRLVADPVASGLAYAKRASSPRGALPKWDGHRLEKRDGFALDLNGIAKGYAVDLLCDIARAHPDTASCLIEIGGELKGFGTRADAMPYWTDLAPDGEAHHAVMRAALYGWACATSGEAERCHRVDEASYSHILDPRTQASARSDLIGVSVFDKSCARADALATALMVMGHERALAFADARSLPCALAPRGDGAITLSAALKGWA